jgi:hypothetical protein
VFCPATVYRSWTFSPWNFFQLLTLLSVVPRFFPEHPVLEDTQCKRPSFTSVRNSRQSYG